MSAAPLARLVVLAAVAGAGVVAGYNLRDAEEDAVPRPKTKTLAQELRDRMSKKSAALMQERKQLVQEGNLDLSQYIELTYRALYWKGRCAEKLSPNEAKTMASELRHLHTQHRPRKDKALAEWYLVIGQGSGTSLVTLLDKCPEVQRAKLDPRYIAFTFGEASENLPFGDFSKEVVNRAA